LQGIIVLLFHGFGRPVFEELQNLILIVAFAFFKQA
jgi:hypothetical protein